MYVVRGLSRGRFRSQVGCVRSKFYYCYVQKDADKLLTCDPLTKNQVTRCKQGPVGSAYGCVLVDETHRPAARPASPTSFTTFT